MQEHLLQGIPGRPREVLKFGFYMFFVFFGGLYVTMSFLIFFETCFSSFRMFPVGWGRS